MAIKGNRTELLLRHASKSQFGLEFGPCVNPLAPKSGVYNVKIVYVFDWETLLNGALEDPYLKWGAIDLIELVDFACAASEIGEFVSLADIDLDYILSSHNLEHIPDPILCFKGCLKIFKPDLVLSTALLVILSSEFIVHFKKKPFTEEDRRLFYESTVSLLRGVVA